jgi:hypothetical protein
MMFAAARGERGGFGIPVEIVSEATTRRHRPVEPGPCAG